MIHTPTPWTYHKHGNKDWIEDANTDIVVEAVGLLDGPFICEAVNNHDRLTAEVARLREALKPFAHPDLCKLTSNNIEGDSSPIFGRDKALLVLGDFRRANKAINPEEPK